MTAHVLPEGRYQVRYVSAQKPGRFGTKIHDGEIVLHDNGAIDLRRALMPGKRLETVALYGPGFWQSVVPSRSGKDVG